MASVSSSVRCMARKLTHQSVHKHKQLAILQLRRCLATQHDTFKFSELQIAPAKSDQLQTKPDPDKLTFGHHFSDHMLEVEWDVKDGWHTPRILPLHNLSLHPGAKVLHYAIELFEGIKAYRGVDNKIRMFRPEMNMKRMHSSAQRAALPTFDGPELLQCISELIRLDREWVPYSTSSSLYIRPTMIGTEGTLGVACSQSALCYVLIGPSGPYFPSGFKPISLYADAGFVRAWPAGAGAYKMGSNYAPTILVAKRAQAMGCQQVLWLYGKDEKLTEVGTMNIFLLWTNQRGERELITPPLEDGIILPGVTRQSVLDLVREWGECKVTEDYPTMAQVQQAVNDNRLHEMFGVGTACVVCPVESIKYKHDGQLIDLHIPTMQQTNSLMQRLFDAVNDIQYGRVARPDWQYEVC